MLVAHSSFHSFLSTSNNTVIVIQFLFLFSRLNCSVFFALESFWKMADSNLLQNDLLANRLSNGNGHTQREKDTRSQIQVIHRLYIVTYVIKYDMRIFLDLIEETNFSVGIKLRISFQLCNNNFAISS